MNSFLKSKLSVAHETFFTLLVQELKKNPPKTNYYVESEELI